MTKRAAVRAEEISVATADTLETIGARIRDLRTKKGQTLQALAEFTGLSASMLSLVERGKASPSIGSLIVVASALDVHMSDLFAADHDGSRDPVSRASEQPIFETSQGVLRRVLREDRVRGVEIAVNEYAPQTGNSPVSVHHAGFEYGVVLEGELTIELDGTEFILRPGDLISYESERSHRIWNYGSKRVRALWVNIEAP